MTPTRLLPSLLIATLAGLSLGPDPVRAEAPAADGSVLMKFSIPPFAEEATVVGIDGWLLISSGKAEDATVRTFGDSRTGLLLRTHGIQKMLELPLSGQINLTAVVEFGSVAEKGNRSFLTFAPMVDAGVGAAPFGFDNTDSTDSEPGGFYYTEKIAGEDGAVLFKRVNLLPREVAYEGARYTLSVDMDLASRTYVLTITGTSSDGTPVNVKSGEVRMDSPDKTGPGNQKLTGLRLASSMPENTQLYIESMKIALISD
jgi:hypothetical protein